MNFFKKSFIVIEEARATGRGNKLWLECLKFVGVFLLVEIVMELVGGLLAALLLGELAKDPQVSLMVSLYFQIFGIGLMMLYCRFLEKRPITSMGFRGKDFWRQYLRGLLIGFGMMTAVVLLGWALGGFRYAGLYEHIEPGILLLFFLGFMIQGMFEEVMCRGYFMVSASRKSAVLAGVIANSVLFALLHVFNGGFDVLPAINLVLFGAFASLYMLKTDNIWGAGAIHSVWNFSQGCFFGLSVSGMPLLQTVFVFDSTDRALISGGAFGPEGGLPVTLVYAVGIALLLFLGGKKAQNPVENT